MREFGAFSNVVMKSPFNNNIEMNALLVPQIRRNIVVEKWTRNALNEEFEEVSLEGSFFHAWLCIRRVKIFFG